MGKDIRREVSLKKPLRILDFVATQIVLNETSTLCPTGMLQFIINLSKLLSYSWFS